ncbi:MAG: PKD domain-containing protein [Saprospiraceae bacterium]|nr:PKD domain-containing protein [Saprospiraceae bacterium]
MDTTNGNIVSGANQLVASVNAAGMYNLKVTNTSNGCINNSTVEMMADTLEPLLNIISPSQLNCVTSQVTIDASQSSNGSNFTYAWSTANGNIVSGSNTLAPIVNLQGVYNLIITNTTNGCTSNGSRQVDQNIVVPTLSVPDLPMLTCAQPEVQICATTDAVSLLWNVNENNSASCITVNKAGSYVVTATGNNGCTYIATSTVTMSNEFPQMNIADPDILTCIVQEVNVTATIIGNESEYSYIWSTQNGSIISGQNSLIVTVSEEGTYTLSVTNLASGCSVTQSKTVNEISQAPSALFEATLVETALTANTSSIAPNNSYLWDFGNGTTSTQANTTTLYTSNGVYNVCLTVTNDCGANTECQSFTVSSILTVSVNATDASCFGSGNGTASVNIFGGLAPFTIVWSGPNNFVSNEASLTGLALVSIVLK